jgi:co-chaperonin GroES (HSP10)
MATLNRTTKIPKVLGANVIIKGIERCKTEGGIYLPGQSEKTDKKVYNREFYVDQIGPDVDSKVNDQLSVGDAVFLNWIPTIHPIITDINSGKDDEDYIFYFACQPSAIVCKF